MKKEYSPIIKSDDGRLAVIEFSMVISADWLGLVISEIQNGIKQQCVYRLRLALLL